MHPCASLRTSNFLTLPYISTSVGNGFRGECIRSAYTIFTWYTAASYFPSNIARIRVCNAYTVTSHYWQWDGQYVPLRSIMCIDERFSRRRTNANIYAKCSFTILMGFSLNHRHPPLPLFRNAWNIESIYISLFFSTNEYRAHYVIINRMQMNCIIMYKTFEYETFACIYTCIYNMYEFK